MKKHFLRKEIVDFLLNNNPLAIKLIAQGTVHNKNLFQLRDELKKNIFNDDDIEKYLKTRRYQYWKTKSLYHSIKYSYDKLNDKEKLAFELMSLFPDGIHYENFKLFSKQNSSKTGISDREIISLNNKSLLENSNGFLKLQSIINRFSDFHFKKRDPEVLTSYYTACYAFNQFFLNLFGSSRHFKNSSGLILHDQNLNNYLKCVDFIELVDVSKSEKLDFIDDVSIVLDL